MEQKYFGYNYKLASMKETGTDSINPSFLKPRHRRRLCPPTLSSFFPTFVLAVLAGAALFFDNRPAVSRGGDWIGSARTVFVAGEEVCVDGTCYNDDYLEDDDYSGSDESLESEDEMELEDEEFDEEEDDISDDEEDEDEEFDEEGNDEYENDDDYYDDSADEEESDELSSIKTFDIDIHIEKLRKDRRLGVVQELKFSEKIPKDKLQSTFVSMGQYYKEFKKKFLASSGSVRRAEGGTHCINKKPLCVVSAASGACTSKNSTMISDCPLACKMCLEPPSACKRASDAIPAIAGKGDIDALFKKLARDNGAAAEILWSPSAAGNDGRPWAATVDGFVPKTDLAGLLHLADSNASQSRTIYHLEENKYAKSNQNYSRVAESVLCDQKCRENGFVRGLVDRITTVFEVPTNNCGDIVFTKFVPRQRTNPKLDGNTYDDIHPEGVAALSILVFLSGGEEGTEGGILGLPNMDYTMVRPKAGRAVIWSNVRSDDPSRVTKGSEWEVMPVVTGSVSIMKLVLHMYDYQSLLEKGCLVGGMIFDQS